MKATLEGKIIMLKIRKLHDYKNKLTYSFQ